MASMLEYIKMILQKVSFDRALFEKELRKAVDTLPTDDIKLLRDWCYDQFGKIYGAILNNCFAKARLA